MLYNERTRSKKGFYLYFYIFLDLSGSLGFPTVRESMLVVGGAARAPPPPQQTH